MWLVDGDVYLVCLSYRKIAADFLCGLWPCVHSSRWESTVAVVYRYIFETWVSRQILSALRHFGNEFSADGSSAVFTGPLHFMTQIDRFFLVLPLWFSCMCQICKVLSLWSSTSIGHLDGQRRPRPIPSSNLIINFQVALQGTFRWGHHGGKNATQNDTNKAERFAQFLPQFECKFLFFRQ